MTDKTLFIYIPQAALAFSVLAFSITPIVLIPGIVASYLIKIGRKPIIRDNEVLTFSKEILRNYEDGLFYAMDKAASKNYSFANKVRRTISRYRLGEYHAGEYREDYGNLYLNEVMGATGDALSSGSNIRNNLSQFVNRLENDIKAKERARSKDGGMRHVTYLGMAFFLPLFGGISSTILKTTGGIVSTGTGGLANGLVYTVAIYIALILIIDALVNEYDLSIGRISAAVIPIFSLSVFMLAVSSTYVSYAI